MPIITRPAAPFFARPIAALALAGLLLAPGALASTQEGAQDDPFSILAPTPMPVMTPQTPVEIEPPAGPHLDRDAYFERRGGTGETQLITRWRVEQNAIGAEPSFDRIHTVVIGPDYAADLQDDSRTILDFATGRELKITGSGVENTAIAAHVHQQMDTFSRFTGNGTLTEITGPGGARFERFWIEAALGVRASAVTIYGDTDEDGNWLLRRRQDTPPIVRIERGDAGSPDHARLFASWLRHNAPIHPDALVYFTDLATLPQSFSFIVFSPSSPDGRRETWTLLESRDAQGGLPWPEDASLASAEAYNLPAEPMTQILALGLEAATAGYMIEEDEFLNQSQYLTQAGDKAGAYLALYQANHHQAECTPSTNSAICNQINRALINALGQQDMEALITAVSAGMREPQTMLDTLLPYRERPGLAGGAANLLAAQAAAAITESGGAPAANPLNLFLAAAQADPASPMTYWHAGRFAAANGDYQTAWLLFDIARSLPAPLSSIARGDAGALKSQLESLAPVYFGPQPALPAALRP